MIVLIFVDPQIRIYLLDDTKFESLSRFVDSHLEFFQKILVVSTVNLNTEKFHQD